MAEESSRSDPNREIEARQDVSAADFVPLDDSDSSDSASNGSMDADAGTDDNNINDSIWPETAGPNTSAPAAPITAEVLDDKANKKRKPSSNATDHGSNLGNLSSVKKLKLVEPRVQPVQQRSENPVVDKSILPAEIWHHIFSWLPPKSLGNLLLVNRLFNAYLDPLSTVLCDRPVTPFRSALSLLQPDDIWKSSRRRFWPGIPDPLKDQTELYMWQLTCSKACQHCGLRPSAPHVNDSRDVDDCGPGTNGVAIIWVFATRSCGQCLLKHSMKEIDILLSTSIPSTLTAALPFVFLTQQLVAVSPAAMRRGQPATTGPLTKLFWSAHVNELKQEVFRVKSLGTGTAEDLLKWLDGRGLEWQNDFSRWENWDLSNGGVGQMRTLLYPGYRPHTFTNIGSIIGECIAPTAVHDPGLDSANQGAATSSNSGKSSQTGLTPKPPSRSSSSGGPSHGHGRLERTKEEIAELKAARKAAIERRAQSLDPPLSANVLAHMPSFQAALQIITPLDDQGWEVLKPRLIAQRPDAEQREKETMAHYQREMEEKRIQFVATKSARDAEDADWDEVQAPLRARIAGFADEIIRDGWDEGEKVGRENCSKFAVEVLKHIRKQFYAEIAKDAAAARAAGKSPTEDLPGGPFTQKLTLDNMKWIFDVKIKPHTEKHRKELFLCNGCDITTRYYGFEGVIQHFAAKHTHALSVGNVVVHWRAEWPENPPFTSEPKNGKAGLSQAQPQPPPGFTGYQPGQSLPFQAAPPAGPPSRYYPSSCGDAYQPGPQGYYFAASGAYAQPTGYASNPYPPVDSYQSFGQPPGTGPYNYNYGAIQSNGQIGHQALQLSPVSTQYKIQLEEMARISRDLWNATSNMNDTLAIVRVQVVVFHLAKRFHAKFGKPLPLATFIDGLSNHKDMRPVRNVNGLICRVCHQRIGGYVAPEEERKSWSLPQLTSHFQTKHMEPFLQMSQYRQPPEWTMEMVLLPDASIVANLRSALALDGQKYHLVNEAVPQLLAASDQSQTAAAQTHEWPEQSTYYQNCQGVSLEAFAQLNGQGQLSVPRVCEGVTVQCPTAAGSSVQYPARSSVAYNHFEAFANGPPTVPLLGGYKPSEPGPGAQIIPSTLFDPISAHSIQGLDQGREQTNRHSKKNKKKVGNDSRDSVDEQTRKRHEEEKMAEEEAEREADIIRAMWAKDRANVTSKPVQPEEDRRQDQVKADKLSKGSPMPSLKANTPQQRHRFQLIPPRESSVASTGGSPLLGPEIRQTQTSSHGFSAHHGHQLSNMSYVEDNRGYTAHGNWRRTPEKHEKYKAPEPQQQIERHPARSPVYMEYGFTSLPIQYSHRSPPRQLVEPLYQPRQPLPPAGEIRLECTAAHQPPRGEFMPRRYHPPAAEYVEVEVTKYRGVDGFIWVEERPLRRIPSPEADRYYRDVPPPPAPSAAHDQGDYPPPARRVDQPPPGDSYQPTTYERVYSRAPVSLSRASVETYDPRQPQDSALRRNDLHSTEPSLLRAASNYRDDEYDPRFPAGPPPW